MRKIAIALGLALIPVTLMGCAKDEPAQIGDINAPENAETSSSESSDASSDATSDENSGDDVESDVSSAEASAPESGTSADDETSTTRRDVGTPSAESIERLTSLAMTAEENMTGVTSIDPVNDVPNDNAELHDEVASHLIEGVNALTSIPYQRQLSVGPLEDIFAQYFFSYPNAAINIHNVGYDNGAYLDPNDVQVYDNGSIDEGVVKVVFTLRDSDTNEPVRFFDGYCDTSSWMFKIIGGGPVE